MSGLSSGRDSFATSRFRILGSFRCAQMRSSADEVQMAPKFKPIRCEISSALHLHSGRVQMKPSATSALGAPSADGISSADEIRFANKDCFSWAD